MSKSDAGCSRAVITGFFQSICGRSKMGRDIYLCPECTELKQAMKLNKEDYESIWISLDHTRTCHGSEQDWKLVETLMIKVDAKIKEFK